MWVEYFSDITISARYSWYFVRLILSLAMLSLHTMLWHHEVQRCEPREAECLQWEGETLCWNPSPPPSANTKVKLEDEAVLNYFKGLELGC